jgi:uncharacterized protein
MQIEVVWIAPGGVVSRTYQVSAAARVGDALELAARDPLFADAGLASAVVGVFGRLVAREDSLADGDRIEIYRGRAVDPKAARRARARAGRPGR